MNGIAPVDTGYIRSSAQEIGNMLQEAHQMRMSEVTSIMSMQSQLSNAVTEVNSMNATASSVGTNGMGGSVDIIT